MTASLSPIEELAERVLAMADQVTRIRAHHRLRPHVFLEDKQELAREMRRLASDMKTVGRLPSRTLPGRFQPGPIVSSTGRIVRVEVRRRAA